MADNKNNNWLAAVIGALFVGGVFKIVKFFTDRNKAMTMLETEIHKALQAGQTDEQILQACYDAASQQFGRSLSADEQKRIEKAFIKVRNKIKVEN